MPSATPRPGWNQMGTQAVPAAGSWFNWSDLTNPATFVGVADCGVVVLYMRGLYGLGGTVGSTLLLWYAAITLGKLVLLTISWDRRAPLTGPAKWLIGSTSVMALATIAAGVGSWAPYLQVVSFILNFFLTSALVGQAPLNRYVLGPALIIPATAAYHALLCFTHRMPDLWGRYYYFGFNQFNLGGEIESIGCLAVALLLPRLLALPALAIMIVDMNLMQARSALLVGVAAMAIVLAFDNNRRLSQGRAMALAFLVPIAALLLVGLGAGGKIGAAISTALLINDPHRGVDSGGSGRADLWNWSLQLFEQSPVIGHDLSYFDSIGFIGSHNLFMYGLAQYGLMSLLLFGTLIFAYAAMFRRDFFRFCVLLGALPLLLFNDRFTNLNPYPFMFFILLTTGANRASRELTSETS